MRRRLLATMLMMGVSTGLSAQGRGGQADTPPPITLPPDTPRITALKQAAMAEVERRATFTQQMVDQIFSYGELGFQEFETHKYLVAILREHGFTVEEGVAGIPTAFVATWTHGTGGPTISLGSDIDGIPKSSQKPGVAYHDELVPGAPGHGEGHNSGQAVNITAALVIKDLMARENIPGTIHIWPGTAEELVATKAYFVREGLFKGVDVVLFSHVGTNLGVSWGDQGGTGLVSVEYTFTGESAHSAGSPWRGRSALDAVELMNVGWNFQREHLPLSQRSHYVITGGGDQPNVVPQRASVWYYFRQTTYPGIREMWALGDRIARGAAMMTGTTLEPTRMLGAAWPRHFSRPVAEATYANIQMVGLPQWSEADQTFARAVQREVGSREQGLETTISGLGRPVSPAQNTGGGSDDIGDISWNVPTITLRFPSNVPGLPGHNWSSGISMATPVAHTGATAGAKVQALTMIDLLLKPELVKMGWDYFTGVQTREQKYEPLIRPEDRPAIDLNRRIMDEFRERMRPFYFDPTRYKTYLEQLGVTYPTVRRQ
ncbi:MAG TPA: amidohydrolase [Vicinamibacterales bacterium]|nr:amidohydrolase [Vicinamibacterales bacterium]